MMGEKFEEEFLIMLLLQLCSQLTSSPESAAKFAMQAPPEEGTTRAKSFELVFGSHMRSLGLVLCALCNLSGIGE
jgi:hypothetical protein